MSAFALTSLSYIAFAGQGEDGSEMMAEVWRHVHAFNREHGNVLGIDFPEWVAGTAMESANTLRVFGTSDQLMAFIRQPRGLRLLATGGVSRSAVTTVPAGSAFAAPTRDSSADKVKPAQARRRERRGQPAFSQPHAKTQFSVACSSKTNGHSFLFKMKKRFVAAVTEVSFSSYGMCVQGGLPQF
ncbi:MAG: type I-F CRISPR-associated endoribonuclease Cas6/Csy4 [Agitococcus sp.]|nr:type I-F CRISPR-associated endoribonuclease Cas6/Csy4 [Agitococcus sp.]MDO9179563.1 type I-F CRISPR-associated endoribonuclease Cas6/Csy4 [Agitococcus sp.]